MKALATLVVMLSILVGSHLLLYLSVVRAFGLTPSAGRTVLFVVTVLLF